MQTTLSIFRKAITTTVFFLSLTTLSQAQSTSSHADTPFAIRYVGVQDDLIAFDVHLAALPHKSVLRILDGEGNLMHQESIRTASFQRRYKIRPETARRIKFEVSKGGTLHSQAFDIAVRFEEKLLVTAAK